MRKNTLQKNNQRLFVMLFLIPTMLLYLFFSVIPLGAGIIISFFNYNPVSASPPFIGLTNYINAFKDEVFIKSFVNTLKFVVIGVSGNILISTVIAVGIVSVMKRFQQEILKTVYFLPTVAPITAMVIVFKYMMDPKSGIHNWILRLFGETRTIYWLGDAKLAFIAIIVLLLWQDFGINMVIIMAGIQGNPKMIYEAALIDGAGEFRRFRSITLPLIIRTIAFVTVMTVISYFQLFTQIQIMTDGGPQYATQTIGLTVYQNAFKTYRMGYASALSVILMLTIMVVSIVQLKAFKTDLEY